MSQMEDDMADLKRLVASMAQLLKNQSESKTVAVTQSSEVSIATLNAIETRIQEFVYSPEDGATFEKWWNRHEDIFMIDLKELDELKKIRLLIRHISTSVERTFTESIAPTKWMDMKLDQVKAKMLTLFGDNTSIFDRRRTMLDLKMSKENIEDVRVLAARVNQTVENAQVKDATINEWKVLTFLHSLDLPRYSDVHLRMMQTAKEKGNKCTLDDLLSVFNDISQLKKDSRSITESRREVNYVDRRTRQHESQRQHQRDSSADSEETVQDGHTACYCCGNEGHMSSNCRFRSVKCNNCGTKGHLARVCKKAKKVNTVSVASVVTPSYRIQVTINGLPMSMAIDTGADITIVSDETWKQLGRPAYERDSGTVQCANGDDLRLRGRFIARMEYGGMSATSDVYIVHGRTDLLGKNFIKLLQLVKVRVPEAKDELVKAYVPEANVRLVKASMPEAKHKKGVKVECEVGQSQDHNEPEAKQINLVKVDGAAESFRVHHVPEATVKVHGSEATDAGSGKKKTSLKPIPNNYRWNEIDEKEAENRRISVGNGAGNSTLYDPGMNSMSNVREGIHVTDEFGELDQIRVRNRTERNIDSSVSIVNSTPLSSTSSSLRHAKLTSTTQRDCHPIIVLEGKPHKKTNEGKPQKETKQ